MTRLIFVDPDGTRHEVEAENGATAMETALRNGISGIVAECGGSLTCATCHVHVDDNWIEKTGGPSAPEEDMLDFAYDVRPTSRLSCQIKIRDELDGLVLHIPARQS